MALLPAEMCPWIYVSPSIVTPGVFVLSLTSLFVSICLIVFSLIAETPHDVIFYWKYA